MALASEVLDNWDLGGISTIDVLQKSLNVSFMDIVKNLLDWFIDLVGELSSNRTVQDTCSLDVLVNNSFEVFGLPQRILLEEDFESLIENWNERNWLLAWVGAHSKEIVAILSIDQLNLSFWVSVENGLQHWIWSLQQAEALDQRVGLASRETFLNSSQELSNKVSQSEVDPSLGLSDVHELNTSLGNLFVSHVLNVANTVFVLSKPWLLEVGVELLDDVVTLLLQSIKHLCFWKREHSVVHLLPEDNCSGSNLVDWFTHLGLDSQDTSSWFLVCLLPFGVRNTGAGSNGFLGVWGGLTLLGNHNSGTEQNTIERHWWVVELGGPSTSQVWISVLSRTESRTCNKNDVWISSDLGVHLQDWLMEVLERVVTTTSSTSPLHNNREVRVGLSNVDTLADGVNRTWLQSQVGQAQSLNVFGSNFERWNTSSNRQRLDRESLGSQILDQWNTPLEHSWADIN
ncbi:hypothetical protein OGAPHI_005619 [Ogataea philodendri]|uniref:Uncharacterized protein n=1 Tax=Ogataea philodendri TaxID=1378263 RepID=A0A9P8P025_9ASCO|nr:uncharacterized protein OGAPHI_005619 [Ogataea philodendri]KAH3662367.1 hypothetical protein OGAPHI_005619 [Ogataea philodendri]